MRYVKIVRYFLLNLNRRPPLWMIGETDISTEKIVWKLSDSSNSLVGFFFMEDGKMKLEDLEGNQFEVPPNTTLKQAIRILLSKQSMIC